MRAVAIGLLLYAADTLAKPVQPPADFPIAMTFGSFEKLKENTAAFDKRLDEQQPFPFIHLARANAAAAKIIHQRWPDKVVTVQESYGGIRTPDYGLVWPGHLLYQPGTLITQAIGTQDTTIVVDDATLLVKNNQRLQRISQKVPFALILYPLTADGKPDWSRAEHLVLNTVDGQKLTVQRGQWGSKPQSFAAGKAVVAAHMMYWQQQWQLNFSLHGPRGGANQLTAAEWFARYVADRLAQNDANGVEFDVARWTWGNTENNPMDADNDRVADYGYLDGVNSFGLGGQVFFRELRRLLGPDKIIQADSNDAQFGIRGWQYLNGVQLEAFPAANDFNRFPQAFMHLRLWAENAQALPRISYPFTKTPTTLFANVRTLDGNNTDNRFRIGLAAACLTGMPHPFANLSNINFDPANAVLDTGKHEVAFGVFAWDEYNGGDLHNWHWLGRPISTAQQDLSNLDTTDWLAKADWQWSVAEGFKATSSQIAKNHLANVTRTPANTVLEKLIFGVKLTPSSGLNGLVAGQSYTLEFDAKGDDTWHSNGQTFAQVPRMIAISGAVNTGLRKHPLSVLVDSHLRHYRLSFIADGSPAAIFGIAEQVGATEIGNIKLFQGSAERWSREFENGMVLLNMTQTPWQTHVRKNYYRHLKGGQNPGINSGQAVADELAIPPQDAVFLVKR